MANLIPEEKISEVRNAADIVEVVSEAVSLKRNGNNYLGLCPFHSEKTPSFSVSPDKQIFYCFGCGTGGSVFSFLMKQEGLTFPEAVRTLARRYGVSIPRREMSPGEKNRLDERRKLLAVNAMAAEYFRGALQRGPGSERARGYLENRGFTRETLAKFDIGYAPDGWDNLLRHLRAKRVPDALIEKCGLAVARKSGNGFYDRFRNRIMVPICDLRGEILGFGGRVLDDELPKYLNSPETALYSKSRSLYGLNAARTACRESGSVFVVEGYFDLIALVQHGVANVVATLGTALTAEHARLLRGLIGEGGRAILVFDSDEAGIRAAQRGVEVFDNAQVNAQVLVLESGHDPDSFVFRYGAAAFRQAAENSQAAVLFLLETAIQKHGTSVEGIVRIIEEMTTPLASITDGVERSLYVKRVAERLRIDELDVRQTLRRCFAEQRSAGRRSESPERRVSEAADPLRYNRMEAEIVAMMLQVPEMLSDIQSSNAVALFHSETMQQVASRILATAESREVREKTDPNAAWIAAVLDHIAEEPLRALVSDLAMRPRQWSAEGCRKLIGHFVENRQHRSHVQRIDAQIRQAEQNNDPDLLDELLREKQQLAIHHYQRKTALLENE